MKKTLLILFLFLAFTRVNAQYVWTQKANFAGGNRAGSYSFSIGNKGYVGSGLFDSLGVLYIINDLWQYDPQFDVWTQMMACPGGYRASASTFSAGGKGYVCCGSPLSGLYINDCWEYDPVQNNWMQKANFPGASRYTACSFVVGNFAYVGSGKSGPYYNDFYKYDPINDIWTQIANIGGSLRQNAKTFSIGNYGYVVGGANENSGDYYDLWQYDPVLNAWTQQNTYPGQGSYAGTAFELNGIGYAGSGATLAGGTFDDFYTYDAVLNLWSPFIPFGGGIRNSAAYFTIGNNAYMGLGSTAVWPVVNYQSDWWELSNPTAVNVVSNPVSVDLIVKNKHLYFDLQDSESINQTLKIYDHSGRELYSKNISGVKNLEVDFGNFAKGIYLYSISGGKNDKLSGRFIF